MSTYMAKEIKEIPNVVENQRDANAPELIRLSEYIKKNEPSHILTVGRGSSYNASIYAKYLFETSLNIPVTIAAPSLASIYGKSLKLRNSIIMVTSQSGQSPDLLKYIHSAKEGGSKVIGVINNDNSPLAKECDFLLNIHAGEEKSVAATKSYIGSLSVFAAILATWEGNNELADDILHLPDYLEQALNVEWPYFIDSLLETREMFCIGRGIALSCAFESALKLKETCQIHAEGLSSTEILHGPASLIHENYPILSFILNDASRASGLEVNKKLASFGANILTIDTKGKSDNLLEVPKVHDLLQPLIYMTAYYKIAEELSIKRGLNPDIPPNLKKVTETL